MLGSVLGAVASVASKIGEAAWARNSANHAYRQSVTSATHAHQWEMEDLKAAGLNPILTANAGASAAPFMAQTPTIDLAESMQKGEQSALARSQKDLQKSQAVLNYSNSANLIKNLDKIDQDIAESRQRQATGLAQQGLLTQQSAESMERTRNFAPMRRLLGAQAANQMAQAGFNSAQATSIGFANDWARRNPTAYDVRQASGPANNLFSFASQLGGSVRDAFSLGANRLGSWLGSFGSRSSAQSSFDLGDTPF